MEGCIPHIPHIPLDSSLLVLITMSLTTMPTSRFFFSMMWGKFCHSCFEITARTALAQFVHFTLKTMVRFQRWGFDPPPPLSAPLAKRDCAIRVSSHATRRICQIRSVTAVNQNSHVGCACNLHAVPLVLSLTN